MFRTRFILGFYIVFLSCAWAQNVCFEKHKSFFSPKVPLSPHIGLSTLLMQAGCEMEALSDPKYVFEFIETLRTTPLPVDQLKRSLGEFQSKLKNITLSSGECRSLMQNPGFIQTYFSEYFFRLTLGNCADLEEIGLPCAQSLDFESVKGALNGLGELNLVILNDVKKIKTFAAKDKQKYLEELNDRSMQVWTSSLNAFSRLKSFPPHKKSYVRHRSRTSYFNSTHHHVVVKVSFLGGLEKNEWAIFFKKYKALMEAYWSNSFLKNGEQHLFSLELVEGTPEDYENEESMGFEFTDEGMMALPDMHMGSTNLWENSMTFYKPMLALSDEIKHPVWLHAFSHVLGFFDEQGYFLEKQNDQCVFGLVAKEDHVLASPTGYRSHSKVSPAILERLWETYAKDNSKPEVEGVLEAFVENVVGFIGIVIQVNADHVNSITNPSKTPLMDAKD